MSRSEAGFTLIEILIALTVFFVLVIGTFAVLAWATTEGYLGAFPTSLGTTRVAKDYTAASVYLQALEQYVITQNPPLAAGCYTTAVTPTGSLDCPPGLTIQPSLPAGAPTPVELGWREVQLLVQPWGWVEASGTYSPTPTCGDCLKLVQATVYWEFKGRTQQSGGCPEVGGLTCLQVRRFIR